MTIQVPPTVKPENRENWLIGRIEYLTRVRKELENRVACLELLVEAQDVVDHWNSEIAS